MREEQSGWVLQAVISRAWRIPRNGKSYFTMMSLHINNAYAKKRGIAKNLLVTVRTVMHQQQVDLVAGDFTGAAWRRQSGSDSRFISSIEEAFVNTNLPLPPGPTPFHVNARLVDRISCEDKYRRPISRKRNSQPPSRRSLSESESSRDVAFSFCVTFTFACHIALAPICRIVSKKKTERESGKERKAESERKKEERERFGGARSTGLSLCITPFVLLSPTLS